MGTQMQVESRRGGLLTATPIPPCEPEPLSPSDAATPGMVRRRPDTGARTAGPRVGARVGRPVADRVDPSARTFAVTALTRVLEVLDRRRPVAHLTAVAVPHIVDQVTALIAAAGPATAGRRDERPPAASLLRVHVQWAGPDAAEIAASYARGPRVHAIAARVQRLPVRVRPVEPGGPRTTELRWMLVNVTTV